MDEVDYVEVHKRSEPVSEEAAQETADQQPEARGTEEARAPDEHA